MIHWKYIKGLNQDNNEDNVFTFIDFSDATVSDSYKTKEFCPYIYISGKNSTEDEDRELLGRIIVSEAENQTIDASFRFNDKVEAENGIFLASNPIISFEHGTNTSAIKLSGNTLKVNIDDFSLEDNSSSHSPIAKITQGAGYRTLHFATKQEDSRGISITGADSMIISGDVQGTYFNATSDRRAKDNLQTFTLNALDVVKNTPLYSFNYIDTDTQSIGIIAQDIQNVSINGFKLVDNENATGKDMDYMTIHESKLIYVLWKAIQEQQDQIESLKEELNSLKK